MCGDLLPRCARTSNFAVPLVSPCSSVRVLALLNRLLARLPRSRSFAAFSLLCRFLARIAALSLLCRSLVLMCFFAVRLLDVFAQHRHLCENENESQNEIAEDFELNPRGFAKKEGDSKINSPEYDEVANPHRI